MRVSEISIHALRGEGDPLPERLPRHWRSISIHALRGEGDACQPGRCTSPAGISIHALRGEGDSYQRGGLYLNDISIHALRGEGDSETLKQRKQSFAFLSTPSAGRATWRKGYIQCTNGISIHALRGEGDKAERPSFQIREISIHALRGEGDQENTISRNTLDQFLSTPSAGRATHCKGMAADIVVISIHALRGEGDQRSNQAHDADLGISIHALRGEGDLLSKPYPVGQLQFLSTPSAGRATLDEIYHALHDRFLSTPSAGRATNEP